MNPFKQGDFLIDAKTTPEMLQAKRDRLAALMPQYGKAQYIGEGLGQLFNGIGTGRQNKAMDGYEGERSAEAAQQFAAATGGPMSILGMRQQDQPTAFNPDPTAPATIGNDTMAALGKPSNNGGLQQGIIETAQALGIDPADLATAISYETAGTFDPTKAGPTTQWGQHRGLIQFGEPQAAKYGVDWNDPIGSQLGANGAVAKYLQDTGVKPGMGMMDIYSAINAGGVGRYGASDANNGGAPGTVADKVNSQMAGHRQKAMALLGGEYTPANAGAPTQGQPMQGGQDMDALLQAQANPWLTQSQRAVLDGMISQRQSQQAAAEDRYWRQNDPAYQQGLIKGQLEIDAMRNPAPAQLPASIQELEWKANALGLTPNTPEYVDFIRTGGGAAGGTDYGLQPVYGRDKDGNIVVMQLGKNGQAVATALPEGVTPDLGVKAYEQGFGTNSGANAADIATGGDAARAVAAGAAQGKADVEAGSELKEMERNLPGLEVVVEELNSLADEATYTVAGQLKDSISKQFGGEPSSGAIARAKYIAIVDNQVLPLLRQTFGAAFTEKEGATLRATLGDADKSPAEKKAMLEAFMAQKKRDLLARQGSAAPQAGPAATGAAQQGGARPVARFNPVTGQIEQIGGN